MSQSVIRINMASLIFFTFTLYYNRSEKHEALASLHNVRALVSSRCSIYSMYNGVDTIIAKARYTTSLPTLISDFYYWSVLTGLVFGEGISFYSSSG